jgi:hypothetical protein
VFDDYVIRYRQRLLDTLGDQRPYLFAFKRILMRARRPNRLPSTLTATAQTGRLSPSKGR